MDVDKSITHCFDEFVKKKFHNQDIRNFLLRHERRHLCENNLKAKLKEAHKYLKTGTELKNLIDDFVAMFCQVALEYKHMQLRGNNGQDGSTDSDD